jgi:hypothetical protein
LKTDAAFGNWLRVLAEGDTFAFVKTDDVKVQTGAKATAGAIRWARAQAAPVIALDKVPLVTRDSTTHITGTLSDERHLRDVFVFVNDKKVYFKALDALEVTQDGVKSPLDMTLPLKPGENTIAIVARESKDLVSRAVLGIYREQAEAVAEMPAKKPAAQ